MEKLTRTELMWVTGQMQKDITLMQYDINEGLLPPVVESLTRHRMECLQSVYTKLAAAIDKRDKRIEIK